MFRAISKLIFKIIGWKIAGVFPEKGVNKSILIVIPHTSNWDFPLGVLARSIVKTKVTFIMKGSMFKPPFGWVFRWLDGMPVDRSKSSNFVDGVIDLYNKHETFHIVISPEGTRKNVEKLKTGFYYIALGAKIPIIRVKFDYGKKEVHFGPPFYPTGDKEKDIAAIKEYFKAVKGKIPENSWAYEEKES